MKQTLGVKEKNSMFDFFFDSMADFHNYFPNNNSKIVISKQKLMNKVPKYKKILIGE